MFVVGDKSSQSELALTKAPRWVDGVCVCVWVRGIFSLYSTSIYLPGNHQVSYIPT